MARRRASMREGPLAELFRATEAAKRSQPGDDDPAAPPSTAAGSAVDDTVLTEPAAIEPETGGPETRTPETVGPETGRRDEAALEATVEHVYDFEFGAPAAEAGQDDEDTKVVPIAAVLEPRQ